MLRCILRSRHHVCQLLVTHMYGVQTLQRLTVVIKRARVVITHSDSSWVRLCDMALVGLVGTRHEYRQNATVGVHSHHHSSVLTRLALGDSLDRLDSPNILHCSLQRRVGRGHDVLSLWSV